MKKTSMLLALMILVLANSAIALNSTNGNWTQLANDSYYSEGLSHLNGLLYSAGGNSGAFHAYNITSDSWTDLSGTDTGAWATATVYRTEVSDSGKVYTGLSGGQFGVYDPATNVWTDLSSTDPADWASGMNLRDLQAYGNLIFTTGTKVGVYNESDGVWTDLSATIITEVDEIISLELAGDVLYLSGLGELHAYNITNGSDTSLSDTDPDDWVGNSTEGMTFGLSYDGYNGVYTHGYNGKLGYYNFSNGVWENLSGTDTDDWVGTNFGRDVYSDGTYAFTIGVSGFFGVYDPSTGVWTNISGTDDGDWVGTRNGFDLLKVGDEIYTGFHTNVFGKYLYVEEFNCTTDAFSGGNGSVGDPYQISNLADLNCTRELAGVTNYVLINDIDASDTQNWSGGGFINIDDNTEFSHFDGIIDGAGYAINDLKLSGSLISNLFFGGTIKNITFNNLEGRMVQTLDWGSLIEDVHIVNGSGVSQGGMVYNVGANGIQIVNSSSYSGNASHMIRRIEIGGSGHVVQNSHSTVPLVGLFDVGTIKDSYSEGSKLFLSSGTGTVINSYTNGSTLCDTAGSVTVVDSYYEGAGTLCNSEGKTSEELKLLYSFSNWDFANVWYLNETNDYPRLRTEDTYPALPSPTINNLSTSNETILLNSTATISWSVSYYSNLDLSGTNVTGLSEYNVSPETTTTYILTATNDNGSVNANVTITVIECTDDSQCTDAICLTNYTIQGQICVSNYCEFNETTNTGVLDGAVCDSGSSVNANASNYCNIIQDCVEGETSALGYFRGYTSDQTGSCSSNNQQASPSNDFAVSDPLLYIISTTETAVVDPDGSTCSEGLDTANANNASTVLIDVVLKIIVGIGAIAIFIGLSIALGFAINTLRGVSGKRKR